MARHAVLLGDIDLRRGSEHMGCQDPATDKPCCWYFSLFLSLHIFWHGQNFLQGVV